MTKEPKSYKNLQFDLKVYDLETGFKKRGKDPGNKERKAVTKCTGLSYHDLDIVLKSIKLKY